MGLFGGGSTTKSKSWSGSAQKWAQPFAQGAARDVTNVYDKYQPALDYLTNQTGSLVGGLKDMFTQGNPAVDAGRGYVMDVLGGAYAEGNPFLQSMIDRTAGDVTSRVNANFGSRGAFGGTAHTGVLARELANAENGLRYQNYSDEMSRAGAAAGMVPAMAQAEYTGLPELLQTSGVTAELPFTGTDHLANNLAALFQGEFSKSKTKSSGGLGGMIGSLGGAAINKWG